MRIIYMGTPEFAVPSLDILYTAGYKIVGVITSVDKMGGRGRKTRLESAVKKYAISKGLKVLQPTNLKNKDFLAELQALKADVQIVVAFRMLPVAVWDMPPLGTYNLHGSLLPKYRGAAPINWAIINGDNQTGVTSFKLKHEIDTGLILLQKSMKIYQDETATQLHDRMKYIGADIILETVRRIELENIDLKEQSQETVSHAPKLNRDNTEIDFDKTVGQVYNHIRGLSEYPCAWFSIDEKRTKVYYCRKNMGSVNHSIGEVVTDNKSYIKLTCSDGYIHIDELQMAGKKRMNTSALLNGYNIKHAKIESY